MVTIENKWVFWVTNPLGDMLYMTIREMIDTGILETKEDDDTVMRWNPEYQLKSGKVNDERYQT